MTCKILIIAVAFCSITSLFAASEHEPTAEETLMLEFINRFRADPGADADLILKNTRFPPAVDKKMFEKEMKSLKPSPPLVFNLNLMASSRNHARYMIPNGQGHTEEPGKEHFTGKTLGDRIKKVGYKGGGGENAFLHGQNMWHSHAAFLIDWGPGGTGGMQPGRGHRVNLIRPSFNEIGIGAIPHGNKYSVIQNFGARRGLRFAGGVAYKDKNNNGFYDVGEGLEGVKITAGGQSVKTWSSGAYTLQLKKNGPVIVTAEYQGKRFTKQFTQAAQNIKFDYVVSAKTDFVRIDKIIAGLEKQEPGTLDHLRYSLALHELSKEYLLDHSRQTKINTLTADTVKELKKHQNAILSILESDPNKSYKLVLENRKRYGRTASGHWFNDAMLYLQWYGKYRSILNQKEKSNRLNTVLQASTSNQIKSGKKLLKTDYWKKRANDLFVQLNGLKG